jgi:hypothetical protein
VASEHVVDGSRGADGEAADARCERACVLGLGDEMDVILLDGIFDHPEITA